MLLRSFQIDFLLDEKDEREWAGGKLTFTFKLSKIIINTLIINLYPTYISYTLTIVNERGMKNKTIRKIYIHICVVQ